MQKDMNFALLELVLPEGILDYFEIKDFKTAPTGEKIYLKKLTIYLDEKKQIPEEYKDTQYKASGFAEPRIIEDYPIRDMLVSLSVKRRRWDVKTENGTIKVSRDWSKIIKQGTKKTKGFVDFLKEISRQ